MHGGLLEDACAGVRVCARRPGRVRVIWIQAGSCASGNNDSEVSGIASEPTAQKRDLRSTCLWLQRSSNAPMAVSEEHQRKRHEGDEDFAQHTDDDRTPALVHEVAELRAQTDTGKRRQKCPFGKVG